MFVKKFDDQPVKTSPTCGELRELIKGGDYQPLGVAIALDIKPTIAHYHEGFDEIYFVLDGEIKLELYDPKENKIWTEHLGPNDLCVITKGIHHKITEATESNRLCVISAPPFRIDDEHLSGRI